MKPGSHLMTLPAGLAKIFGNPWMRLAALTCYYLAILAGLIIMYGKGDFSTPGFIYQNF
jgi:hypothetical protein